MELSRIIEIIQANCTVMPSQPSGVVYVFDKDELSATAELIFNEMQLKGDVPLQLHKHDVIRWVEVEKQLPKCGDLVAINYKDGTGVACMLIEYEKDIQWLKKVATGWHLLPPIV